MRCKSENGHEIDYIRELDKIESKMYSGQVMESLPPGFS